MNRSSRQFHFTERKTAFTLVELLVVIAIIALLVSILLPAMAKARDQAKFVMCMSNLRQIVTGALMWSDDHDEWVLPASWSHINTETGEYRARLEKYLDAEKQGRDIYRCPLIDKNEAGGWDPQANAYIGKVSYGMNFYLCVAGPGPGTHGTFGSYGDPRRDLWGPDSVYFYEHGNTRLPAIKNASNVIYFMDFWSYRVGHSTHIGFFGQTWNGAPETHREKGRRHDIGVTREDAGKANIAWLDGHVSIEPGDFEQIDSVERSGNVYSINGKYFLGQSFSP